MKRFELEFLGAAQQVTGSMYLLRMGDHSVLLECGLIQGSAKDEEQNAEPFPFDVREIDAVVLSHAHIDHSGRVPLLVKRGYQGPVYVQNATLALCRIMLPDSGYIHEKDAERKNRRRHKKKKTPSTPLYTRNEAKGCLSQFTGVAYEQDVQLLPGITLRFHDAGHILGSSIVELTLSDDDGARTLVFSGDLGYRDAPVMNKPTTLGNADVVLLESTYGDRLHRPYAETMDELASVFESARTGKGNILIPAFTVGRTQDLLFLMAENYERWNLDGWHIFLDSPMAIEATAVYSRYRHLFGARLFGPDSNLPELSNFHETRSTDESIAINNIAAGAIIIAGSGMCSGGRILHHLENNIWRPECHVVIVGFQAFGTLGRRLVDGSDSIRLWGKDHRVEASIHTIGGLSAHADQAGLINWYRNFENRPPVYLVHGEDKAQEKLAAELRYSAKAPVSIARYGQKIDVRPHLSTQ